MSSRLFTELALCSLALLVVPNLGHSQDALAEQKTRALKGLHEVAIVLRRSGDDASNVRDLVDIVEVALHNKLPGVKVVMKAEEAENWLEVMFVNSNNGCAVGLTLYRWVRVVSSKERIFAPVWTNTTGLFGSCPIRDRNDVLENLLTRFAGDYVRAQRLK